MKVAPPIARRPLVEPIPEVPLWASAERRHANDGTGDVAIPANIGQLWVQLVTVFFGPDDAELVALWISENGPRLITSLTDIDGSCPETMRRSIPLHVRQRWRRDPD